MRFLSVCSGIEAASVAWGSLGWEAAAFSEIEPFCCALLDRWYPGVPNLGDVTRVKVDKGANLIYVGELGSASIQELDIIVGGFPCQDVSVAGKRQGLRSDDGTPTRSGLFFEILRLCDEIGQRWTLLENVPGLLSSNEGRDFAAVVGALAGIDLDVPRSGWKNTGVVAGSKGLVEWAVLDAQWFGVPQRRRRVFIIRDTGDWLSRPPVLFESACLRGNPSPRREAGEGVACPVASGSASGGGYRNDADTAPNLVPALAKTVTGGSGVRGWGSPSGSGGGGAEVIPALPASGRGAERTGESRGQDPVVVAPPLTASNNPSRSPQSSEVTGQVAAVAMALNAKGGSGRMDGESETFVTHSLVAEGHDASEDGTGRGTPLIVHARQDPVTSEVAQPLDQDGASQAVAFQESQFGVREYRSAGSLRAHGPGHDPVGTRIRENAAVRRLTVTECERLMGFPDGYTQIPYRGKPACDGPRYRALGNSMVVPVVAWIGERIAAVTDISTARLVSATESPRTGRRPDIRP